MVQATVSPVSPVSPVPMRIQVPVIQARATQALMQIQAPATQGLPMIQAPAETQAPMSINPQAVIKRVDRHRR